MSLLERLSQLNNLLKWDREREREECLSPEAKRSSNIHKRPGPRKPRRREKAISQIEKQMYKSNQLLIISSVGSILTRSHSFQ